MGLDMYLHKVPRISTYTLEQIDQIEENLDSYIKLANSKQEAVIPVYEPVKEHIRTAGKSFTYHTLFEEIGYWRKAQAIHNWFVTHVQEGEDECERYEVSREQAEALLNDCRIVLRNKEKDETYDSTGYYYECINYTIELFEQILKEFDFEHYYLTYRSSW